MLMRMISLAVVASHAYAGECNTRLLDSYANTLEQKIWEECVESRDITERLDFVIEFPKTNSEDAFLSDPDNAKYPAFQSFFSLCKQINNDSEDKVKFSVTALFKATADKYFKTVRRLERAKAYSGSTHYKISEETVMAFLTADKSRPAVVFA
jgi:hypothetical protein